MSRWPSATLGSVATLERSGVDPAAIKTGTPYVGLEHITSGGEFVNVTNVDEGDLKSIKFSFGAEHLLYGKLRPYLAKIALPHFSGICSTEIIPIRPGPKLDRNFLLHFLRLPSQVGLATSRSAGANLPRLSPTELAKFDIPLPPLPEQRRIAAILDQADVLRAKRRAALDQLDEMAQAIFVEMFVSTVQYPMERLDSLCSIVTDGTHYTPTYAEFGVPFLSAKNVTSGYINWDSIKFIPKTLHLELQKRVSPTLGDVLLAKNGTTGVAAIVDRDTVFDIYVSLALLRPITSVKSVYLLSALNSEFCRRQFTGALKGIGVPNLHLVDIRRMRIPAPPREIQELFCSRIASVEALRSSNSEHLKQTNCLFASLQHRAFRGEL